MQKYLGQIISCILVCAFLLGAGFRFLSFWEMTRPGYVALGILLTAATLWVTEAVPLFVTSLLVLLLSLTWLAPVMRADGIEVGNAEFSSPFFSDIILLFLGGFVLSEALHKLRLDELMARWIMKKSGSSVPRLILGVMLITAFLSMWLSNTATAAMMLALVLPIAGRLPAGDPFRSGLILSIPFAANVGGLGTPIGSPPNAIGMEYMRQLGVAPSFGSWMMIGVPGVIVMLVIAWGVLLLLFPGETRELERVDRPMHVERSRDLYLVLATTLLTVLGWMTGAWHGYSSGTIALIPVVVFFGTRLLSSHDLRSLSWDVLLLMGGGLCLGTAISRSGLADWLIGLLPIEGMPVYWLMVMFGIVGCIMSSVMSNTATSNLIMPILMGVSIEPRSPLFLGVAFACSLAMPLPVSTPPNAMAFSSGEITVKDMVKPGLLITVIGVCLAFTTGFWWWQAVGMF